MEKLELYLADYRWKEQLLDYKREFQEHHEVMHGCAGLDASDDFECWLKQEIKNHKKETVQEGLVPATVYLCVRKADQKLVGMVHIRHELNEYLMKFGGHIGCSIRASERRKGYAKEMLHLALLKCAALGLQNVLVTCDKENESSRKTILANGGVLENEAVNDGNITQRYWISCH